MGTSVGDCSKQAYPFYIIEGWQIAVKFNVPNSVLFWSCNSGRSYPNEHHALPTMCCVTVVPDFVQPLEQLYVADSISR